MENKQVSFSFDGLDILTFIENKVYLRGIDFNSTNDIPDCIIILTKKDFNKALNEWFKHKEEYYKHWEHFCGVGSVVCSVKTKIGETKLLVDVSDKEPFYKDVATYECVFDYVDMEHG